MQRYHTKRAGGAGISLVSAALFTAGCLPQRTDVVDDFQVSGISIDRFADEMEATVFLFGNNVFLTFFPAELDLRVNGRRREQGIAAVEPPAAYTISGQFGGDQRSLAIVPPSAARIVEPAAGAVLRRGSARITWTLPEDSPEFSPPTGFEIEIVGVRNIENPTSVSESGEEITLVGGAFVQLDADARAITLVAEDLEQVRSGPVTVQVKAVWSVSPEDLFGPGEFTFISATVTTRIESILAD